MKSINPVIRRLIIVFAFLLAVSSFIVAQDVKFKVGDRVEVDSLYMGDSAKSVWRKGTIVKMDGAEEKYGNYWVKLDYNESIKPFRFIDKQWIRPLEETETEETSNKTAVKPKNTDKTESVDKTATTAAPTKKPAGCSSAAAFKYIIAEFYRAQKPGFIEVIFQNFRVGAATRYTDPYNRAVSTKAYPVSATYMVRQEYDSEYQERDWDNRYYCYTDTHGECVCTQTTGGKGMGKARTIPKEQ